MRLNGDKSWSLAMMLSSVALIAIFFTGCIAAVPVVVYYQSKSDYVATVELNASAADVYQAAVEEVDARPQLKIVEKKDPDMFLEVTDGKQTASVKAVSIEANRSKLIVTADIPGIEQEKEEELALRAIDIICKRLGVTYQLVEG